MRQLALLFAFAVTASAQQQSPTFIQIYEVRVSNLDVVVTDKDGKNVHGLKRGDFEVFENGVAQPITNFADYRSTSATAAMPSTATTAAAPEAPAAEAPPPKKIAFFIDELSLHPRTRAKLLDNALQLVNQLGPADQVSVIRAASDDKVALPFTADHETVRKALHDAFDQGGYRVKTRLDEELAFYRNVVASSGTIPERRVAAHEYAIRVNERVKATLTMLSALVAELRPQPGKKIVVVVSESISAEPGREAFTFEDEANMPSFLQSHADALNQSAGLTASSPAQEINVVSHGGKELWYDARPAIQTIGATAAAAGITIYSLQPDLGMKIGTGGGVESSGSAARSSSVSIVVPEFQREILEGTRRTLGTLADTTGGKMYIGELQFENAFQQIESDISSYYSIGYRPTSPDSATSRTVEVRIKNHPDYAIRTRRELIRESPTREMNDLVASTLLYPQNVDELHVSVEASRPERAADGYAVTVKIGIPLNNLTFVPNGNVHRAMFSVHFAAADDRTTFATGNDRQQALDVPEDHLAEAKSRTFTYSSRLIIRRGTTRIGIGVQDPVSRLTSFKTITVTAR